MPVVRSSVRKGADQQNVLQGMFSKKIELLRSPGPRATVFDLEERVERVNSYFRLKAGLVLESPDAINLLLELHKVQIMRGENWPHVGLGPTGVVLALLAVAGFCDVTEKSISITDAGVEFVKFLQTDRNVERF